MKDENLNRNIFLWRMSESFYCEYYCNVFLGYFLILIWNSKTIFTTVVLSNIIQMIPLQLILTYMVILDPFIILKLTIRTIAIFCDENLWVVIFYFYVVENFPHSPWNHLLVSFVF